MGNNVIQQQQQQQHDINSGINSETSGRPRQWTPTPPSTQNAGQQQQQQLPNWIMEVPLGFPGIAAGTTTMGTPITSVGPAHSGLACPEIVWRQIRWPQTEANALAQMPCPASLEAKVYGGGSQMASLWCQANGQWASHVDAAQCQSHWVQNLTARLEAGDSPLSALDELVKRTALTSVSGGSAPVSVLYGSDLIQMGRIVARLVADMESMLGGISDDKQRIAFAREMIQVSRSDVCIFCARLVNLYMHTRRERKREREIYNDL